jgi:hypothetical protein
MHKVDGQVFYVVVISRHGFEINFVNPGLYTCMHNLTNEQLCYQSFKK